MDQVKEHFQREAREFDQVILNLIPHYGEMVAALISALPFAPERTIRTLDLGCGTGTITVSLLRTFPKAEAVCLDFSEEMIRMAKTKLAQYPGVRYMVADFREFAWKEGYDAIVSSLALHHLATDKEKQEFYRRAFAALNPGGCFFNADVVLGSSARMQEMFLSKWKQYMRRSVSDQEIEETWMVKYREEDHPAALTSHLQWLSDAGFRDIDVVWKYYNFAVFGGVKG